MLNIKYRLRKLQSFLIVGLIVYSCNTIILNQGIEFHGFQIGDTIDQKIEVVEVANSWISYGTIVDEPRSSVWLFNNHIERIRLDDVDDLELAELIQYFNKQFKSNPQHNKGEVLYGLIYGEEYLWEDSLSGYQVYLVRDFNDDTDSLFSMSITNSKISSDYRGNFFDDEEDVEYDFTIIEE